MANMVVARFADGRLVKGSSLDVNQNRPTCHLRTEDGEMVLVKLDELKALFFVKSLTGDAKHVDTGDIDAVDPRLRGTRLVEATFDDGEKIVGLTNHFPPTARYFFITPVDTAGNNLRVLVNRGRLRDIQLVVPPNP